jgi:hypothetical protein
MLEGGAMRYGNDGAMHNFIVTMETRPDEPALILEERRMHAPDEVVTRGIHTMGG